MRSCLEKWLNYIEDHLNSNRAKKASSGKDDQKGQGLLVRGNDGFQTRLKGFPASKIRDGVFL